MARTGYNAVLASVWRSSITPMTEPARRKAAVLRRQRLCSARRVMTLQVCHHQEVIFFAVDGASRFVESIRYATSRTQ